MLKTNFASLLCFMGVLLILLGLLTGFGTPVFRSPRIGVSAHLAAIEGGLVLTAFGLLWQRLDLRLKWQSLIAHVLWISLYVVWIGLVVGAVFGTTRVMAITTGAGMPAPHWQEHLAARLITWGSFGALAAIAAILAGWRWRKAEP